MLAALASLVIGQAHFARRIDHPSDLGILFLANVYNIQKADRLANLVRRVLNYHQGLPYWP